MQITYTLPRRRTTWQSRWRVLAVLREERTCISVILFQSGNHAAVALVECAGTALFAVLALLAGVNGMGGGRGVEHEYGVFFAVFPLHGVAGRGTGADEPAFVGTAVEE